MEPREALEIVERAFADVERPGNDELLHPQSRDDTDIVDFYEIAHWRDVSDEQVIGNYAALAFLSPAGFRYFIPAYMGYVLRNPESNEAVVDSTVWSFNPPMYEPDLQAYVTSKFSTLSPEQRAAVDSFLAAMVPHNPDAQRTLDYWRAQAS